jgi:DNA mismatch repair protein MSH5
MTVSSVSTPCLYLWYVLGLLKTDGAGLFAGVLKHLLARGSDCPKVIATTHFHELFTTGLLEPEKLPITFVYLEIMFATRSGEIIDGGTSGTIKGETITYLYRLVSWDSGHLRGILTA